jgi:glycosyltransferase involved in cell wall biosynthesis
MTVWLFAICRNESKILPYFLRHYVPWVDKLIFYDDQSDDGTRELIKECPKAELRDWTGSHGIVDDEFTSFANEQWKEARGHADWVIWVDLDEFLYCPNISQVLQRYLKEGVSIPRIHGYTMVSQKFPTTAGQIYDEIKTGWRDVAWDKSAIFRENMIWNTGRHSIHYGKFRPKHSTQADIKLLHYRCLGMDYLRWRHNRNWERVPTRCRELNYGRNCEPGHDGHHGVDWFEKLDPNKLEIVI